MPNAYFSAFVKLAAGKRIKEHSHANRGHFVFHLCLHDLDGYVEYHCDGKVRRMQKKGDWALFETAKPHYTVSHAKKDRVNLIVDFVDDSSILLNYK